MIALDVQLRGKSALRPAQKRRQHLAGGVHVIVDRLLAGQDNARLFFVDNGLEDLGHGQGLDIGVNVIGGHNQDRAVRTHCQRRAQRFLRLLDADRHRDHLVSLAGFSQADGLFDGNLVKGVHRHFHIGKIDARSVRFDANLHVIVDHAFDRYEHLHWHGLR